MSEARLPLPSPVPEHRRQDVRLEAVPLLLGGSVLQVGSVSVDLPALGTLSVSSALAFDIGVYLAVVGMVLMVFETFGDDPVEDPVDPAEVAT